MALTLEEALTELGILKGKVGPLEAERDRLLSNKERLEADLSKVKARASEAENERDVLKGKVPVDGTVALTKADSERWRVLSGIAGELGGVDKVQERLGRVTQLEAERGKAEREATIRSAGYDPKKLERLIGGLPLKVEADGDTQKVTVTVDDKEMPLSEWAELDGISDLLNVARQGAAKENGVPAAGQPGRRETGQLKTVEERVKEKQLDPNYSI